VDDQLFFTGTSSDVGAANYPFNAPEFFIFNVAVGGNWPGPPDGTTPFPQRMFVDYVRVFQ
jgi:beta-glucanase (GH16 family)